jgi:hypothetical protein
MRIVNTDPEQWIFGAWQAQASDGWRGPIRSFKWRARLDAWLHRP